MLRINELRVPLVREFEQNLPEHHLQGEQEDKLNAQLHEQLKQAIITRLKIKPAELISRILDFITLITKE